MVSYEIVATAIDPASNRGTDGSARELFIDTIVPVVTVEDLLTHDTTPILTGTVSEPDAAALGPFTVSLDDGTTVQNFSIDDPELTVDVLTGMWTLDLSTLSPELERIHYDVTATMTDQGGNIGTIMGALDITVAPTVVDQRVATGTPVITGTSDPREGLIITVDGIDYELGVDAELTRDGSGNWTLDLSALSPALIDGNYDVTATTDTTSVVGSLIIDLTGPQVSDLTAVIEGQVSANVVRIEAGDVSVVPVAGRYRLAVPVPASEQVIEVRIIIDDGRIIQRTIALSEVISVMVNVQMYQQSFSNGLSKASSRGCNMWQRVIGFIILGCVLVGCSDDGSDINRPGDQAFDGDSGLNDRDQNETVSHQFTALTIQGTTDETATVKLRLVAPDTDASPTAFSVPLPLDGLVLPVDQGLTGSTCQIRLLMSP